MPINNIQIMVCLLLADDPLRCKAVRGYYSARTSRSGNPHHICKAFRYSLTKHRKRLLMPANACQTVCLVWYIANLMPNAPQRSALRTLHDSTEILTDKMAEQKRGLGLFGWLLFMSRPVRVLPQSIPPSGQGWDISQELHSDLIQIYFTRF